MYLERVKQRQGEGLVVFIKRYIDQALLCMDTLLEPQLVYRCIRNVEDESQIYLFMSNINTFSELLKRASDITEAMKRNGRRSKKVSPLEVCAVDGRGRRRSYSRNSNRNSPSPPLPLSRAQPMVVSDGLTDCYVIRTMFHKQVKEGKILLTGEQNQKGVKSTPFS
ncbi:hypothetical protein Ahy_A10g047721 [Arachis hypogaea]|uniref:Uncharacterized protein n=1 Tax=Arachis hypogaea TaxID=3818 RepID=A0A445B3C6_ARAHY|nr:hypothetical protein Ahy_A10g047721 [Arachis hypogaea]